MRSRCGHRLNHTQRQEQTCTNSDDIDVGVDDVVWMLSATFDVA